MKYKISKTSIKEGCTSSVRIGQYAEGDSITCKNPDTGLFKNDASILDIEVGDMVLLIGISFIKTSAITKIVSSSKDKLVFETETSVYLLEKLDEQ